VKRRKPKVTSSKPPRVDPPEVRDQAPVVEVRDDDAPEHGDPAGCGGSPAL
jgi:hypothetical protein